MSSIPLQRAIHYPESDGKPMAETDVHVQVLIDLITALRARYAGASDVYVAGNMLLYYREGEPKACVAPDVFVVQGVGKHRRRTYKLWEEDRAPSLVIEATSESTRREDLETKKALYEKLGVEEYFLFDPLGEYLRPRLQGHRLAGGRYQPLAPAPDGSLPSATTGLVLRPEGETLRLVDAATGAPLLFPAEETAARQAAEQRAEQEALARQAAERRLRALEEELARLRHDPAR